MLAKCSAPNRFLCGLPETFVFHASGNWETFDFLLLHNLVFSYSLLFFTGLSNVHQLYRMSISRIPYSSQLGSMFSQIACDLILPQFQNLFIRLLGHKTLFRIHPSPSTRLFTTSPFSTNPSTCGIWIRTTNHLETRCTEIQSSVNCWKLSLFPQHFRLKTSTGVDMTDCVGRLLQRRKLWELEEDSSSHLVELASSSLVGAGDSARQLPRTDWTYEGGDLGWAHAIPCGWNANQAIAYLFAFWLATQNQIRQGMT